MPGPSADQAELAERAADARLARVHLRGGLLALSRASLEKMAGAGTLDREAMADLAEARWRSGDLQGAAEAARAHQSVAGTEPIATLILAEEQAMIGNDGSALAQAQSVADRIGGAFDVLFAMEPRSQLWPDPDDGWMPEDADGPGHWGLLAGGSEVAHPTPATWRLRPVAQPTPALAEGAGVAAAVMGRGGVVSPGGPTTTAAIVMSGRRAGEELALIDQAISAGDGLAASGRLAVLLRLDPALAPVILSAADRAASAAAPGGADLAALQLVRGDAYRILGRDNEAAAAYQLAHQALGRGPASKEPM